MQGFRSFRKLLLAIVAILFAAIAILYSGLWTLYGNQQSSVELGFDGEYMPAEHSITEAAASGRMHKIDIFLTGGPIPHKRHPGR